MVRKRTWEKCWARRRSSSLFIFPVSWAGVEPTAQPHRWHFVKGGGGEKEKIGQKWAGPHDTPRRRNPVFSIQSTLSILFFEERWRRFSLLLVFLSNPQIQFFFFFLSFFLTGGGRRPCWQISTQTPSSPQPKKEPEKDGSRKSRKYYFCCCFFPRLQKHKKRKNATNNNNITRMFSLFYFGARRFTEINKETQTSFSSLKIFLFLVRTFRRKGQQAGHLSRLDRPVAGRSQRTRQHTLFFSLL